MNSHTVSWECINCYPLATSEQTQAHSHTLEWLLQGHLLLLTPSFLCLSLSFSVFLTCCLLHLCTSLHYHCLPTNTLTKRHTHTCTWWAQNTASFSCLGKDTVKLTHPELSCHLCHLRLVCVCICACFYVVHVSVTLGWECSVGGYCQHAQAGVYGQRHRTLIWSSSQTQREHD